MTATTPAVGPAAECPELVTLESGPLAPSIHAHVELCEACLLVLELLANSANSSECAQVDALLAARGDGTLGRAGAHLLDRHLASCADCRAVAESVSATTDAGADHITLPRGEPSAYALGLEIDRGGMGRILAARDLRIGRPVAVKELLGRSPQLAARFEREARVTARLQHPGIVPIYEIGRWPDGTPFYTMRMVEGGTLREAIAKAGSLAARIGLLPAVIAATEAVAFAHSQRVIHRDLTPSNVMVGAYGETVVIDWGLAKDLADTDEPPIDVGPERAEGLTRAGAVIGTLAYMPPEQANAATVDERADVYALGAILYHLLAGTAPYRGRSSKDLLSDLKAGPPAPVEEIVPNAPRDLVSIVAKAMARDPGDRYRSARELADELQRFQTGRIVEAHVYTAGERARRFIARNRAPLAVTAIAAVLLATLGTIAVRRVFRERQSAEATVLTLLEEEGRNELLAGNSLRALAYLDAAYRGTDHPQPALRFMRAAALRDISTVDGDLDCGGAVGDIDFAPDGTTVAAACDDRAKLWRLPDPTPIAVLGPISGGFQYITYSHDGKTLATWGSDGSARLWDSATGALLRTLPHGKDVAITFTTFTHDDKLVSTSGYDGLAKIWDAKTGELRRTIVGSNEPLLNQLYAVFGHEDRLLTFSITGLGKGWNVATGEHEGTIDHGSIAIGGEASSHSALAVTCGMNRLVRVWNTDTGKLVAQLSGATNVVSACRLSDDGKLVLGLSQDHHAYVWDIAAGYTITAVDHGAPLWSGHFSPDGKRFVTVSIVGKSVKVWATSTGDLLASHDTQGGVEAKFSRDGERLVAALGDGRLRVWHGPDGPLRASYTAPSGVDLVAVTSDGTRVATAAADGRVVIRDATAGAGLGSSELHAPAAAATARFAATSAAGAVVVLDARDGSAAATLATAAPPVQLAFTGDGRRLVAELSDGDAEIWDVAAATRIATLDGAHRAIATFDGRRALGWTNGPPRVWDLDLHRVIATLDVPAGMRPIGFGAGGHRIVLEDGNNGPRTITICDADTGHVVATIRDVATEPTLDPQARFLTTILASHRVETWDLERDQATSAFISDQLQQAQIDPRGELIAGIDRLGEDLMVLAANDGRLLGRWPIEHDPPTVSPDGFDPPRAIARWSTDGKAIVTMTTSDVPSRIKAKVLGVDVMARISVWNTDPDFYDTHGAKLTDELLAARVKHDVPWQVSDGRLVPALASLRGRVVRGETPVANATLQLIFRAPPAVDGEIKRGTVAITQKPLEPFRTDAVGEFSRDLPPGRYTLKIEEAGAPRGEVDIDLGAGEKPRVIDLATITTAGGTHSQSP